ncbi:apolipoprotein N-acyltransferase [[Phormidium ambiguum] IAM M-71]|uniref:apolipoprotein N-acyltransferase n=1 Tax=[Phormidium ambiguum] IAM M-71 TaxID=454136 RepID=UPI000A029148|nr:apolipoprotein N-acyltransferase [Phormidium ambiguum]
MKNSTKLRLIISFISGILMGMTAAPFGVWPLAWIALIPLWIFTVKSQKSEKSLYLYAILWAIGYHGLTISWILGLHPLTWLGISWIVSLAIALGALLLFTIWGIALVTIWAIGSRAIFQLIPNDKSPIPNSLIRVLVGTTLWCVLEYIWSAGPFWWTSLSFTQSPHNLAILHLSQISGPNTINAVIVAVNGLIAEAFISGKSQTNSPIFRFHKSYLSLAIGLLITSHLIGWAIYSQPLNEQPNNALKVGIIQGNIANRIKFTPEGLQLSAARYTNGYRNLAQQGVAAVLTPEGALSSQWSDRPSTNNPFYQAILDEKVVAWVGAHRRKGNSFTNSLFTVTGTGENFSRYDKVNLVAFGEYVPFRDILGRIFPQVSAVGSNQIPGVPNQVFDTPFGRAIVGICYDSAFTRHFQRQAALGGQFILTSSNNDPYNAAMQFQHHAQDVLRAIESDRWAIRATNTGYSAIVNPHGQTKWISKTKTFQIHADTVYRRQTKTLYVRWGDWLTLLLLLISAVIFAQIRDFFKKSRI